MRPPKIDLFQVNQMIARAEIYGGIVEKAHQLAATIGQTLEAIDISLDRVNEILTDVKQLSALDTGSRPATRTADDDAAAGGDNAASRRDPTPAANPRPTRKTERQRPPAGQTPAGK